MKYLQHSEFSPRFVSDCAECVFLGYPEGLEYRADVWVCPGDDQDDILIRFGTEDKYSSYNEHFLSMIAHKALYAQSVLCLYRRWDDLGRPASYMEYEEEAVGIQGQLAR